MKYAAFRTKPSDDFFEWDSLFFQSPRMNVPYGFAGVLTGFYQGCPQFFSDVSLANPNDTSIWTGLRLIFKRTVTYDSLSPSEFYIRLSKVLPWMLEKPKPDEIPEPMPSPEPTSESSPNDKER